MSACHVGKKLGLHTSQVVCQAWAYSAMSNKSVETLCSKIWFSSIPPPPQKNGDCTDHSTPTTLNWGAEGIRELTLDPNKID